MPIEDLEVDGGEEAVVGVDDLVQVALGEVPLDEPVDLRAHAHDVCPSRAQEQRHPAPK